MFIRGTVIECMPDTVPWSFHTRDRAYRVIWHSGRASSVIVKRHETRRHAIVCPTVTNHESPTDFLRAKESVRIQSGRLLGT